MEKTIGYIVGLLFGWYLGRYDSSSFWWLLGGIGIVIVMELSIWVWGIYREVKNEVKNER